MYVRMYVGKKKVLEVLLANFLGRGQGGRIGEGVTSEMKTCVEMSYFIDYELLSMDCILCMAVNQNYNFCFVVNHSV